MSALVLGVLGAVFVAIAVAYSIVAPLTVAGLALVSAGVVLTLAGLVLGTIGATRGSARANRAAISAAGVSVAGLAGGLIWLAAFVITTLTGPVPVVAQYMGGTPACAPPTCHAP
ncbi:hypothetical protein PP1_022845 [Pseudonocardia sp. P1]|nr:hypothetical protein Ae707Ps1_4564c [Pseudonocardia sp. Ae707_Ps1]